VPHWYKASHSVAYWNKYSYPAVQAKYEPGVLDTWWFDPKKAEALASGKPQPQSQPANR
jgi:microcin C transport system substrate-binding protein